MARLCKEIENAIAPSLLYLLSLNDSMLIDYYRRYNSTNKLDVSLYRDKLSNVLIYKIPGRMIPECVFYNWLWLVFPIFVIIMGTVGNLLSVIVLCRKSMTHISSYIYLATLAVVDEIILLSGLCRRWIEHITTWSIENYSDSFCKLSQVVGISSSILSVWLIVTLTCERVLIIKRPFEASRYAKASRAKYIICCLMVLSVLISAHFFETVSLMNLSSMQQNISNKVVECKFKPEYSEFTKVWFFIDGAMYSWVPLILLIIVNLVILLEIYSARNIHNRMMHNNNMSLRSEPIAEHNTASLRNHHFHRKVPESSVRNRETKQLTIMLMIVSSTFLLTTSPLVILKLLLKLWGYPNNVYGIARLELTDSIFEMLMYLNHAINFYLYCATGNKFRQQLLMLFTQRKCRAHSTLCDRVGRFTTSQCNHHLLDETVKESICLRNFSTRNKPRKNDDEITRDDVK